MSLQERMMGRRKSGDSSKRSFKVKLYKQIKTTRESKVSVIKEELVAEDNSEPVVKDHRENITNQFFQSFFSTLLVDRKPIEGDQINFSTSTINNSSLESTHESYISVSGISEFSKEESIYSKEIASQRKSDSSGSDSVNISCSSTCACCWKVDFTNGNSYEGHMNDDLMEGNGIFHWADGTIYKGQFKDGYPCGYGTLILPDLSTYEGQFIMGFFHGNGKFNVKGTSVLYVGDWKFSKKNGKGWLLYDSNDWYEGDWVDDQKNGKGYRRYANGNQYKGQWLDDKINGQGYMMWHNNDYYKGDWSNGLQAGFGEYIWSIIPHNLFVFPNYNLYKGNWVQGQRTGIGIMNFGHESGAQLAGTWQANKKHGPGVMICGNGIIMEKHPLFTSDKPSVFVKTDNMKYKDDELMESSMHTFKSVYEQIESRTNLEMINNDYLINITKGGASIKPKQYIKLLDKQAKSSSPVLKIMIHNTIHEVDLNYFVEYFTRPNIQEEYAKTQRSTIELEQIISIPNDVHCAPSLINYLSSSTNTGLSASQRYLRNTFELRNTIINFLPQLRHIYQAYATVCVEHNGSLTFEPVLIRLFLWQLYRDIGVTEQEGVSIVEVDEMLMKNPNSCLESTYSPWEPIYFWQFLQAMVAVACLLYKNTSNTDSGSSNGSMYNMFKEFIERRLLLLAGSFVGNSLRRLRDLIPIYQVYKMYKDIGEPHTVEEFLKNTFLKRGETVPCYKKLNTDDDKEYAVHFGRNVVILNNELSFQDEDVRRINFSNEQQKYQGLYVFSGLGRKLILKTVCKICPLLLLPGRRYNMQYGLSFLEFHEIILLLAFEVVEQERLDRINELKNPSMTDTKSREFSRISTHLKQKKKTKK